MPINTLTALGKILSELSHSEAAIDEIQKFSDQLGNTANRISLFNASQAIVRSPITTEQAEALGFDKPDNQFTLLQGDIVSTESAYFLGERVGSSPKYVALNSSCDLVPNRREFAALLRIKPIRESEADAGAKLNVLLKFKKRDSMYLPALSSDAAGILCNAIHFDGICQIRTGDLMLANRIASLSLVGWRIFASFSRVVMARANPRESQMRIAIDGAPA